MTEDHSGGARAKRPGLGSAVNLVLVALALALLGLVLWQNRDKIRAVFAHPLDLRLLRLGVLIFQCSCSSRIAAGILGPGDRTSGHARSTCFSSFIGMCLSVVIPGAVAAEDDSSRRTWCRLRVGATAITRW